MEGSSDGGQEVGRYRHGGERGEIVEGQEGGRTIEGSTRLRQRRGGGGGRGTGDLIWSGQIRKKQQMLQELSVLILSNLCCCRFCCYIF